MKEMETSVEKKLESLAKYLPQHVEKWRLLVDEAEKLIEALWNQAEQLRHVEIANILDMEDFKERQRWTLGSLLNGIQYETHAINTIVNKLNKSNQDLSNKLATLEKASCELNWDNSNPLLTGSPTQPPLARILSDGLEFLMHFKMAFYDFNESFKCINVRDEASIRMLEKKIKIDLTKRIIVDYLALTQYVGCKKNWLNET